MKILYSPKLYVALLICCFSLVLGVRFVVHVNAQQPCTTPPSNGTPAWSQGAQVTVVFDANANFSQAEIDAMKTACGNWNNASNNSGVTLGNYTAGSKPSPATNVLFVTKGAMQKSNTIAEASQFESNSSTYPNLSSATITFKDGIDYGVFPPNMTSIMAHEIGHTFNLGDCYPACNGTSLMGAEQCYRDANGNPYGCFLGPTDCDNSAVNQYDNYPSPPLPCDSQEMNSCYYGGGVWDSANCLCNYNYGGGGGGGGFCTPYYWVLYESWDGGSTWELIDIEYAGCW